MAKSVLTMLHIKDSRPAGNRLYQAMLSELSMAALRGVDKAVYSLISEYLNIGYCLTGVLRPTVDQPLDDVSRLFQLGFGAISKLYPQVSETDDLVPIDQKVLEHLYTAAEALGSLLAVAKRSEVFKACDAARGRIIKTLDPKDRLRPGFWIQVCNKELRDVGC